jgi:putative ABC transport system permease protein
MAFRFLLDGLSADMRFAFRSMRKSPGFTIIALLTLAIGLGANAAIFSFVDAVLLKPLPYRDPDRIVHVWEKPPGGLRNGISAANFLDWQRQNTVFEHLSAVSWNSYTLSGSGEPQRLKAQGVSASYFQVFGANAALGRTFAPDEDQPGKDGVVVLSAKTWNSRFGSDPHILGKILTLDHKPYKVIGILPPASLYDRTWAEIWTPLVFEPATLTRNFHWLNAVGLLKPGVTLQQSRSHMNAIAARIAHDFPDSNKGWGVTIQPAVEVATSPRLRSSLYVWLAAVAAVLLIGCANVANLLLARATERNREIGIRTALGAARSRIVRQLLTESLLLSVAGSIAGLALAAGLVPLLKSLLPEGLIPPYARIALDSRVILFLLGAAVLTAVIFGTGPALQATRRDAVDVLKEGGRSGTAGASRQRLRSGLVISEVALACILLSGAGLLIRSFNKLLAVDPGFDSTNVITMGLPLTMYEDTDARRMVSYYRQILDSIGAVPGVRAAAITSALPLDGWGFGMPFQIAGHPFKDVANRPACFLKMVSPNYFQALGMRLRSGRALSETDASGGLPVAMINETMVKRFFKSENPIGKRVIIQQIIPGKHELGPEIPWQVVGVVGDEKVNGLDDSSPGVYISYMQSPIVGMDILARAVGEPHSLVKSIQSAVWQVNKNQALPNVRTLEQIKTESVAGNRMRTTLLGIFAGVALLLTMIGIYGVISYSIVQRTHELGIRMAIGASTGHLLKLVVRHGIGLTGIGLMVGIAGALGLTRLLSSLLFETSPFDLATFATVIGLLVTVAVLACVAPARRATRIDPMIALRTE